MNQIKTIFALFLLFVTYSLSAQEKYWQQKVDYKMDVSLNPNDNSLQAFAKITYTNHSPDTLRYIWFHLWPNAYKNDKTALSDQLLENERSDFYFSGDEEKGYINRLDFRIDEKPVKTEDHPEHIDIIKLLLPEPLAPNGTVVITTPFHVKLPYNFSRGGYTGKTYQVTQWYPKPAVYDIKGWHPMPYLDQGEFYAEFGDYEVNITVPQKFIVAATGEPQFKVEDALFIPGRVPKTRKTAKPLASIPFNWDPMPRKTYAYKQSNAIDFAFFADTTFTVQQDTVALPSGKIVKVRSYFHIRRLDVWANAINYMKEAIRYHSVWIGDYPFENATVVDGQQGFSGGMEYPTITILTGASSPKELDMLIFHELGHNWFQASLATNERKYPWMDEGMNTYYDNRYQAIKYPYNTKSKGLSGLRNDPRLPELLFRTQAAVKKDQPINTPADSLTAGNYGLIAYTKTAMWMKKLEDDYGLERFDGMMQRYYEEWKFKHPQPEDFKRIMETDNEEKADSLYRLIYTKGTVSPEPFRPIKIVPLYRLKETYKYRPIFITPIANYNTYNGLMPGIAFHNYSLPFPKFNFIVIPMYGLKSKKLNGWSRLAYNFYPNNVFSKIEIAAISSMFNQRLYEDPAGNPYNLAFRKVAPMAKFVFKEPFARSTKEKFIQLRYFAIGEDNIRFDSTLKETSITRNPYEVAQVRYVFNNSRKLYPYRGELLAEYNKDFVRLNFTGNYLFNFRKKGGVNVRFYAGKFIYTSPKNSNTAFETERFHLTMSGPKGDEDYTYSSPFIGRNEASGFWTQQIMIRDGAFKVRTDLLAEKVGKSDDWLTAVNLTVDVPDKLNILRAIPLVKIPIKLFADIGTSGSVWGQTTEGSRLLYDGGLQFSLLNNLVSFYVPLVYSKVYSNYFKSTPGNSFWERISFSINIQDFSFKQVKQLFQN